MLMACGIPTREVSASELALMPRARVLDRLHQDGTWITAVQTDCSHTNAPPVENTIFTYMNLQSLGDYRSKTVALNEKY